MFHFWKGLLVAIPTLWYQENVLNKTMSHKFEKLYLCCTKVGKPIPPKQINEMEQISSSQ